VQHELRSVIEPIYRSASISPTGVGESAWCSCLLGEGGNLPCNTWLVPSRGTCRVCGL